MLHRRVKFVWSSSSHRHRRWRFALVGYPQRRGARLAISLRGAICWLLGLAVAGYVAGTAALFCWFDRRPDNLIGYTDTLLLPLRWTEVRELRGRMMIQEGLADLAAQRWSEAHLKLRVGLARDPKHAEGRRALAQFYQLAGRRAHALTVLTGGLAHGYPGRAYLQEFFAFAAAGEEHEAIVRACEQLLPTATTDQSWLREQHIHALLAAGRFAEALSAAEGGGAGAAVREARVLALLELDRTGEALAYLAEWEAESDAATRATVIRLRVRALREAGQIAAMNAEWERLRELEPVNPHTYLYGVVQKSLAGQRAESVAALEDYFRRFVASPSEVLLAANALASAGDVALVDRCVERAAEQGFSKVTFGLVRVEAQLSDGDWTAAGRAMAEIEPLLAAAPPAERYVGTWLQRLLAVSVRGDEVPVPVLVDFLQERPAPLRLLRVSIEVLIRAERYEPARTILDLAERAYPSSRTLAGLRSKTEGARRPRSRDEPSATGQLAGAGQSP